MVDAELARPDLPRPACRVHLVCGPPAAGKSTYVRGHALAGDLIIDLDMIARARGLGRDRPESEVASLLAERNARLAALASEPPGRVAWVVLSAPSKALRQWWCAALNVMPGDLLVIVPPRAELCRRILTDPDRSDVRASHLELVDRWFARERANDAGILKGACDVNGFPTDPLHPWNREAKSCR